MKVKVILYSCKKCLSVSHLFVAYPFPPFKKGCLLLTKGVFSQDSSSQDKPIQPSLAMGEVEVSGGERFCHDHFQNLGSKNKS